MPGSPPSSVVTLFWKDVWRPSTALQKTLPFPFFRSGDSFGQRPDVSWSTDVYRFLPFLLADPSTFFPSSLCRFLAPSLLGYFFSFLLGQIFEESPGLFICMFSFSPRRIGSSPYSRPPFSSSPWSDSDSLLFSSLQRVLGFCCPIPLPGDRIFHFRRALLSPERGKCEDHVLVF